MTPNEELYVQWLADITRTTSEEQDGIFKFRTNQPEQGLVFTLSRERLRNILAVVDAKQQHDQTVLYDAKNYESLISEETRYRPGLLFRADSIVKQDAEDGFTYTLSSPSDEYLLFLIAKASEIGPVSMLRTPMVGSPRWRKFLEETEGDKDVLMALRHSLSRPMSLRIEANKNRTFQDFSRRSNAFLFQLTYNLDVSLVEAPYLDDLLRPGRIASGRRSRLDEIEAPKRFYVPDLTYHYQMGVSTDSPLLEYLSYFHIAEHFFEQVYEDDLIDGVKNKITQPDFSSRRRSDVRDLIKLINKRQRTRGESVVINEQEALRLTLQKYVDTTEVTRKLSEYDGALLDYYKDNVVLFSDGDKVDIANADVQTVFDRLARRIYKTRNAIVHSKENERSRYVPFEHDKILVKEVPLLRFIAEEIILSTSSIFGA